MFDRILTSLRRDARLPGTARLGKGARYVASRVTAPYRLRGADTVGARARTISAPLVQNLGRLTIGARAILNSTYVPVHLAVGRGATLAIGDDAAVNFGVKLSARSSVEIGARVSFGPYASVADHDADDDEPRPVRIGDDVWLATRVTVKKGVTIGAGAVITAGSVVDRDIPPGVIAGGSPARVIGRRDGSSPLETPAAPDPTPKPEEAAAPALSKPTLEVKGTVVADFSVQELAEHLRAVDDLGTSVDAEIAPFGQVVQTLHGLASDGADANAERDFVFVWTRPESIASFAELLDGKKIGQDVIDAEVAAFAGILLRAASAARFVFVATWTLPPYHRGFGIRDMKTGGAASTLARMNLRLAEAVSEAKNVHLLDAAKWVTHAGPDAVSPKLWYLGKVGFTSGVLEEAAKDLKAALRGVRGLAKKLVVLDLDDTLWGGIVGDAGWQNLRLGGHDAVGEAYVEFQRELKALTRRGVALAVVSKNEESVALEAITSHPEMVLKLDDIVAHRINWIDKAKNIADIAAELNLGLQSAVFLDDNPRERSRVREALPEVYVPDLPKDPRLYPSMLLSLRCFDAPSVTKEDAERTAQYVAERKREELKATVASLDDWLLSLGIRVRFTPLSPSNVVRATQLLNKTNQLNLSTRRLSEVELTAWAASPDHELWTVSVGDKLGDAGLTGLVGLSFEGEGKRTARILDYVLSCRVMGRKVEETLVAFAVERARGRGATEVVATHLPTAKNKPCLTFWKGSGFELAEAGAAGSTFRWNASTPYPSPACTAVDIVDAVRDVEVAHAV